jgi:hypothetical protein
VTVEYNISERELFANAARQVGSSTVSTGAKKLSRWRRMILTPFALFLIWVPVALFLVWAVITKSVVAYLAHADPESAVKVSSDPTALLNLAQARLEFLQIGKGAASPAANQDQTNTEHKAQDVAQETNPKNVDRVSKPSGDISQNIAELRAWTELALRNDPLNARAFRILGQLSARDADEQLTRRFMQASSSRSLHQSAAIYWMMRKSYEEQKYHEALYYADALLRSRPSIAEHVMPILGKIAENEKGSSELQQLIATNPPWRREFFNRLPANVTDARTPLVILLSLKDSPAPPSADDLKSYLNFLIGEGFHELAYYGWLQFLPAEQLAKIGLLFNGGFEVVPSGLPFDWSFTQGPGVIIKIAERPDQEGNHALSLDFGVGRIASLGITQLVTLAPGLYRFEGKTNVDVVSQRGLQWRIACEGKGMKQIAESPVAQGSSAGWQDFSFSFTVPDTDCTAQHVRLVFDARSASEQFMSGSIWYDELQIMREAAAQ